jgi:hypothetical protein
LRSSAETFDVDFPFNDFEAQALETGLPRIDSGARDGIELPMMSVARQNVARQLPLDERSTLMRAAPVISVELPAKPDEQYREVVDAK